MVEVLQDRSLHPVVIGSGIAGLTVALELAEQISSVTLLSRGALADQTSSRWAQGGIAAAFGDDDSADLHYQDTMKAGADLCQSDVARWVTDGAAESVLWLRDQGVAFDTDANGNFKLGLEGGHSHRRIVHAKGDGTGVAIMKALVERVRAKDNIHVIENAVATCLLTEKNSIPSRIAGVVFTQSEKVFAIQSTNIILATGGVGGLWQHTTNPLSSWGQGMVLAARAGARVANVEFMQFHPTAIAGNRDPMPLASEALRGEGATLIDETGRRFMAGKGKAELEPRDIVSRAIWAELQAGHKVFLDARMIADFAQRFPTIYAGCKDCGIDPVTQPIPVTPAAHYHMGGIAVNQGGETDIEGLWACGEVACSGLHGANRLASNSLLEAVVYGRHMASLIAKRSGSDTAKFARNPLKPVSATMDMYADGTKKTKAAVRAIMSKYVGVLRDQAGLEQAVAELLPLSVHSSMAMAGLMVAVGALQRQESRGAHMRTDHPSTDIPKHHLLSLQQVLAIAESRARPEIIQATGT